jgi:hypothetical protein
MCSRILKGCRCAGKIFEKHRDWNFGWYDPTAKRAIKKWQAQPSL